MKTIEDVKKFWEKNPLFVGESKFQPGVKEFFENHRMVIIGDCLAGNLDKRIFQNCEKEMKILDLGCGPGFWTIEFLLKGFSNITAADLTQNALNLAEERVKLYGFKADFSLQNAEAMTLQDNSFDHVNCMGVIHHTPNTEAAVKEIARVLKKNGTACVSVYYKNIFLRNWKYIWPFGKILNRIGGGLRGRGRENIFLEKDYDELVRLYDGKENPVGKSYSLKELELLLNPYFEITKTYFHFFPARALPFIIPKFLHRFLDKYFGFMIYVNLKKK